MEDKLINLCAAGTFVLMLLVCTAFFYLPDLHVYEEGIRQRYLEEAATRENIRELSGLELLQYNNNVSEIKEEEVYFREQLRVAMPEGVDAAGAVIENDYLNQTVSVHLPGADKEYMYQYPLLGKPDGVLDLTYESNETEGCLDIVLEQVCEVKRRDAGEYLYLDFLDPHTLYDRVIVVDAGHGGSSVGAVRDGVYEKDLNLAIVQKLAALLEQEKGKKIGVYYTRTDDTDPSFEQRVALANKVHADLFLSVHNNASKRQQGKVSGTTTLYNENNTGNYSAEALAALFTDEVTKSTGAQNLGSKEGSEIYIIRNAEVPVVLVEVGFLNNPEELKLLQQDAYQTSAAEGLQNAIHRAFEEGVIP